MRVEVRGNDVSQALKALKRKKEKEGVLREMRERRHYRKPSEIRVAAMQAAVRRTRKVERKRLEHEGF